MVIFSWMISAKRNETLRRGLTPAASCGPSEMSVPMADFAAVAADCVGVEDDAMVTSKRFAYRFDKGCRVEENAQSMRENTEVKVSTVC